MKIIFELVMEKKMKKQTTALISLKTQEKVQKRTWGHLCPSSLKRAFNQLKWSLRLWVFCLQRIKCHLAYYWTVGLAVCLMVSTDCLMLFSMLGLCLYGLNEVCNYKMLSLLRWLFLSWRLTKHLLLLLV